MLAPRVLVQPSRASYFALLTILTTDLFSHVIGYYVLKLIHAWLYQLGDWQSYLTVRDWFDRWGIAAGAMHITALLFVLASLLGRGRRFFWLPSLSLGAGPRWKPWLRAYIDHIGWITVAVLMLVMVSLRL